MIRVQAKTVQGDSREPKTKTNLIAPISRTLRAILDGYARPAVPSHWYVPSPQGKRREPDNFSGALRAMNHAAGLPWSCLDV